MGTHTKNAPALWLQRRHKATQGDTRRHKATPGDTRRRRAFQWLAADSDVASRAPPTGSSAPLFCPPKAFTAATLMISNFRLKTKQSPAGSNVCCCCRRQASCKLLAWQHAIRRWDILTTFRPEKARKAKPATRWAGKPELKSELKSKLKPEL